MQCLPIMAASANTELAAYPASNLTDVEPRRPYRQNWPAPWAFTITLDLGADKSIDTFGMLYHWGRYTSYLSLFSRSETEGPFISATDNIGALEWVSSHPVYPVPANSNGGPDVHSIYLRPTPVTARYLRFTMFAPAYAPGAPGSWSCGVAAVGKRWQPTVGHDWGAGRRLVDQSGVRVLQDGGRAIDKAAKVPEFRCSYSGLSNEEMRDLWALLTQVGNSEPVLFVEDPATTPGLVERIHYGTITSSDFYERAMTEKSRMEIRVTEWL